MSALTNKEFSVIYKENFQPVLVELEKSRVELEKKIRKCYIPMRIFGVIALVGIVAVLLLNISIFHTVSFSFMLMVTEHFVFFLFTLGIVGTVGFGFYISRLKEKFRTELKKEVFIKIISLFDDVKISDNCNLISNEEISNMGLFPEYLSKYDDDIVTGSHKGCCFTIDECSLMTDTSSHTTYFSGLIVKVQMNKGFTGKTIVGAEEYIQRQRGYEDVQLEDIEFMAGMKVYSTNQIEARYLLTPSLMERLYALKEVFSVSRSATAVTSHKHLKMHEALCQDFVSVAFVDGNIYLFVPTKENFFEIDIDTSLLNEDKYFDIYCQLQLILSVIDYLKLDLKLGL